MGSNRDICVGKISEGRSSMIFVGETSRWFVGAAYWIYVCLVFSCGPISQPGNELKVTIDNDHVAAWITRYCLRDIETIQTQNIHNQSQYLRIVNDLTDVTAAQTVLKNSLSETEAELDRNENVKTECQSHCSGSPVCFAGCQNFYITHKIELERRIAELQEQIQDKQARILHYKEVQYQWLSAAEKEPEIDCLSRSLDSLPAATHPQPGTATIVLTSVIEQHRGSNTATGPIWLNVGGFGGGIVDDDILNRLGLLNDIRNCINTGSLPPWVSVSPRSGTGCALSIPLEKVQPRPKNVYCQADLGPRSVMIEVTNIDRHQKLWSWKLEISGYEISKRKNGAHLNFGNEILGNLDSESSGVQEAIMDFFRFAGQWLWTVKANVTNRNVREIKDCVLSRIANE